MDEFMRILTTRRSIRKFRSDPIPDEMLSQVLEAVRWSPSWANTQCWEVVVVRDLERRTALKGTLGRNPASEAIVQVPVVLVLCARLGRAGFKQGVPVTRFGEWFMYDLGICTQSLCLAAHSLGLGTVIVGSFAHEQVEKILGVPEGVQVVSMIPIGWPDHVPSAPPRRPIEEFVHQERFGHSDK